MLQQGCTEHSITWHPSEYPFRPALSDGLTLAVHMIQLSHETLISLREAPRHLPCRPNGKRVHMSAVYRWVSDGIRGVCLEAVKVGGTTYTSAEALQRFAEALTEPGPSTVRSDSTPSRAKAAKLASQRLERELNLAPGRLSTGHSIADERRGKWKAR